MEEFLGEGPRYLLDQLHQRIDSIAAGDVSVPRVAILEGPSGTGKTRIVRELYRRLRAARDPDGYWPDMPEAGTGIGRDPLPGRKMTGPEAAGFTWRAGSLPGFAWWQLHCERKQAGGVVDVTAQARPEIEAHLVPMALAWDRAASMGEKVTAKKDDLRDRAWEFLHDGSFEQASDILKEIGVPIPLLSLATSWAFRAGHAVHQHWKMRQEIQDEIDLGQRVGQQRRSASAELAEMILKVTHRELPGVLVVEDAHLMDEVLAELLDLCSIPNREKPLLVVATAWTDAEVGANIDYARWKSAALLAGRAQVLEVPELATADLARIVSSYAPATPLADCEAAARLYRNPLLLEATLSSPRVSAAIAAANGVLPAEALVSCPTRLAGVYRDRFDQLDPEVQIALAVAAGCLPDATSTQLDPFIRVIVADAVRPHLGLPTDPQRVLAALMRAARDRAWLLPGGVSDTFREPPQMRIAYEYLMNDFLRLPEDISILRQSVVDHLAEWIDNARNGYDIERTDQSIIISNWLAALTPHGHSPRPAVVTAAYLVAREFASSYQYGRAADFLPRYLDGDAVEPELALPVRAHVAQWLGEAGRVRDAITALRQLVGDASEILGPNDRETLDLRHALAYWLREAGEPADLEESLRIHEELLADRYKLLGPSHPDTIATQYHLARLRGQTSGPHEAIAELQHVLDSTVSHPDLGPVAPLTLAVRANLAKWRGRSGQPERAIDELQSLLEDTKKAQGVCHPHTLTTRHNLACWKAAVGRREEAIAELRAVLKDRQELLGPDNPHTLSTRHQLAVLEAQAGRYEDAIPELERVLAVREAVLGADHRHTRRTRRDLAGLREDRDDPGADRRWL